MSNQESQFMSQEQPSYSQHNTNTDPRERPSWQGEQQQEHYPEEGAGSEKINTQYKPLRRRGGPFKILFRLVILLIVLVGLGVLGTSLGFIKGFGNTHTETHQFQYVQQESIQIHDDLGSIHVHEGRTADGQITIQETKHSNFGGNINDLQIHYTQDPTTHMLVITVSRTGSGFSNTASVDFDVTLPGNADLQLDTNTGSIDVVNDSGVMTLKSNTGSITATEDVLHGDSTLSTNTGSVTFQGSIDTSGNYSFTSNTGSVDVTLPANASFHVDAKIDTGSFNSNFPGLNPLHDGVGSEVHGDVGPSPQAILTLKTNTGSIDLNYKGEISRK